MKDTTKVVSNIDEAFRQWGNDREPGHYSGRKYYTCPKCSSDRTGYNRRARCVGANIDESGLRTYCNHCLDENVFMLEHAVKAPPTPAKAPAGQSRSLSDRARPQGNGYSEMHKRGRAQWSRRS